MIGAVAENLIAGYLRPRQSVRRLLEGGHGIGDALMMVVLAYLVGAIFTIVIPGARPPTEGVPVAMHFLGLLVQFIGYFIISGLVFLVGRFFGGQGTRDEAYLTMAWYTLVTSFIEPLTLPARIHLTESMAATQRGATGPIEVPLGELAMFMFASGVMLWLLACYIAELHRFQRTWNVLAVILGLSAAFSAVIMSLTSGM